MTEEEKFEVDEKKFQNEHMIALLRLARVSKDAQDFGTRAFSYLDDKGLQCPTNECTGFINEDTFVCEGYDSKHVILRFNGTEVVVDKEIDAKPLVVDEFCVAQGDEGHCKYCHPGGDEYFSRIDVFKKVAFCEECGFFIDFEKKQIGYTREWTN
jgi:hypothetical protein